MQISDFFIRGDIRGAIEYMRNHEGFEEILPAYVAIFEEEQYIQYDAPVVLNRILLAYQVYFRDVFYCGLAEEQAATKLITSLQTVVGMLDADEDRLRECLERVFSENGYHALFGRTQGLFGPYIWKDTNATEYDVELPCSSTRYTVNVLSGFLFCGWMDYLTFGRFGTNGWASADGIINCIEKRYDFSSEKFLVSLLKHEAQHVEDMKCYPGITSEELEYRAKLVELHFSKNPELLAQFRSQADGCIQNDSHAAASMRIKCEMAGIDSYDIPTVQKKALSLFLSSNLEMDEKYCNCQ